MAWGLRVLLSSAVAYAADPSFASWESHGELMDKEALKEKATSQDRGEINIENHWNSTQNIPEMIQEFYCAIITYTIIP